MLQAGFWGYCFYTVLRWWRELREFKYRIGDVLIIRGLLLILVVVGTILIKPPRVGLTYNFLNLWGLSAPGFLTAGFAVQGFWITEAALVRCHKDGQLPNVVAYTRLRDYLDRFLLIAGSILGLGTVSVATLRAFLLTDRNVKSFPSEHVVLFGSLYSILLALAYAPAYLAFQRKGFQIRGLLLAKLEVEIQNASLQPVEEWAAHKLTLDNILRLRFRDWASLGPGLSILAPLVISVMSHMLG